MKRALITFVAVLLLALSGVAATPAMARDRDRDNDNDAAKVILGIAALGILLNQANQNRGSPTLNRGIPYYDDDDDYRGHYRRQDRYRLVPSQCLFDVRFNGRYREVVSGRCMRDYGLSRLPDECAFDIWLRGQYRTVYGPRCLRDYGYRIGEARY